MGLFTSGDEFGNIIGNFFVKVAGIPEIADKLLESKLIIRFSYTDPDCVVVVDCSGPSLTVRVGDTATKAEVEMSMTADIAHKFWFGKVNLMAALTRKQMVAKGPIPKILKLLPAIKPTYDLYPKYLDETGFGKYNIY